MCYREDNHIIVKSECLAKNIGHTIFLSVCVFPKGQELVWSRFREVAEHHLESRSPPGGLDELYQGAELWAFNTDFSLEFPQPLMPYTVLVGGLLNKPAQTLDQVTSVLCCSGLLSSLLVV